MACSTAPADPLADAYALAKEHAVVEGAFSETLMRHWFEASWALCAAATGLIFPSQRIDEWVAVDPITGFIPLSYPPTSTVEIYAGARKVAVLAPSAPCLTGQGSCWDVPCCEQQLRAIYWTGEDFNGAVPPLFLQAVLRVFTFICENRGEVQLDEAILGKSGAKAFLSSRLPYVL